MDGLAAACTEDVTTVPFEAWPDDPIYCGRDGIVRLASVWWESFEGTQIKVEGIHEVHGRIVANLLLSGVQQGVKVEQRIGSIFEFRDGLIAGIQFFLGYE